MLKKSLLMLSVMSMATAATAADITNPFYLVQDGQFGSVTSVELLRYVAKDRNDYTKSNQIIATEEVRYGLTDNVALKLSVGNTWDKWKGNWTDEDPAPYETEKDNENFKWSAGLGWNVLSGPARLQVSAEYGQDRLKNFDGEYKYVAGEVKMGYQFKKVLPYITGGIEIPVGQQSGEKGYDGDKFIYDAKAGIYQGKCEVWSLDTGVRMTYDENTEARLVTAEAEASVYLTPNTAIGVYGTYALDGKAKYDTDIYEKSVGARLRLFF